MAASAAPGASRPATKVRAAERNVFKLLNRFMVPVLRAGLARFMGSPLTGYFLLLRTTGRKSGLPRYSPLNYAILGGCVYVLAGFGESTHWLANLRDHPRVWVKLPAREFDGAAQIVDNPRLARCLAAAVANNSGLALAFEDPRWLVMSRAQLARRLEGRPVVCITPDGPPLVPGPHDPGGWGWVLTVGGQLAALCGLWALRPRWNRGRAQAYCTSR